MLGLIRCLLQSTQRWAFILVLPITGFLSNFTANFFSQFQLACQILLLLLIPSCVFRVGVINQLDWLPIKGLSVITGISFAIEMTGLLKVLKKSFVFF